MSIVEKNIDKIHDLCVRYNVNKLFVFGSVITNQFSNDSDIDFVVDFSNVDLYSYADNYFDFKDSLEELFDRSVDLIENKGIKNPFLKESIDSTKKLIYG